MTISAIAINCTLKSDESAVSSTDSMIQVLQKAFAEHDGLWIKQPYLIIEGVGSCGNNLLFGNNTRQNYMISYDPRAKNVRFNVNNRILRRYQL